MRLKPSKNQRWRVSVYAPGSHDMANVPLVHKSCKAFATARKHFDEYARQINWYGAGKIGRVILHQGKLYRGDNAYIEDDTNWFLDRTTGKYNRILSSLPQ